MARPTGITIQGLATSLLAALVLAGCGGSTPKARLDGSSSDARDSGDGRDLRADSADTAHGEVSADLPGSDADGARDGVDATGDRFDGATGGASGNGSGGSAAGGNDGGGLGGMGVGGMGMGGVGTGGTGVGGMGTGGSEVDAGSDTPGDASGDSPQNGTGGMGGADAATDLAADQGGGGCGAGCPPSVHAEALAIWLASDFGVQCDVNQRVTEWTNRGSNGGPIAPPAGHSGPLCTNPTSPLNGRSVLSFDAPGSNDLDGVLQVVLAPLTNVGGYTVFVVERRHSSDEGYFLGTTLPVPATDCATIAHNAYRFGYEPPTPPRTPVLTLWSGPYVADDLGDCAPGLSSPTMFSPTSPQAALDVEVFDPVVGPALGHSTFSNGTLLYQDSDLMPIEMLGQGYIGRAFDDLDGQTRHSRFHGDIAEIVIYAAPLSSTDIASVSSYLATRWGLPH